jgi:cob(I)alamin adenosyltransferase
MEDWKIYTKTGDKGQTALIGGKRVAKYHLRIETYGTVDELNSFVGLLRDQDISQAYKNVLFKIQESLFCLESLVAADEGSEGYNLPRVTEDEIEMLEKQIDLMNEELPELTNFILPGGHQASSLAHVCRTVCRRAERLLIKLSEEYEVDFVLVRYLNRLSDYFFVLARKVAFDHKVGDQIWKTK